MINGSKQWNWRRLAAALTMPILMATAGCGDFFARKPTEIQARSILEELSQVRESPNVDNPVPEIYRQPPSRMEIRGLTRVFYYTKHHPATQLAALVKEQLGVDASVNLATNQLVLYCKDNAQADTVENYLKYIDVPPVQINIDCLILERFGSTTMDYETSVMVQNLFGEKITVGEEKATFVNVKKTAPNTFVFVDKAGNTLGNANPALFPGYDLQGMPVGGTAEIMTNLQPAFPGASIRETERAKFGTDFGYWINKGVPGHQVRMLVDVLTSSGYLKILLNPTLETVNSQKATVTIKDYTPIQEVKTSLGGAASVYNITNYVWVEDTLTVTPFVYSDGSIGLTTEIKIGSRSKPEGVVQRTITTERSISVAENRILPGESLIIGGMRKSEKRSVIRGVPFFKDLPIIGILFSSKDFEEKGTEIIFILTPSISSGGRENADVVRDIRAKHSTPQVKSGIGQAIGEPFSAGSYGRMVEKQAAEAELRRTEVELAREKALTKAKIEKDRADAAVAEAEKLRLKAEEMTALAQKAAIEAQQAIAAAAAASTATEAERQKAAVLQQQKDAAVAEAEKTKQQAVQAAQEAAAAAEQAALAEQQAQAAAAQLRAAQEAVQKAAAEAEAARAEAQRRAAEEAARQAEIERQKEIERQQELQRQQELERQKEIERQQELQRQREEALRRQAEQEPQ